jgi:hypothetical protein
VKLALDVVAGVEAEVTVVVTVLVAAVPLVTVEVIVFVMVCCEEDFVEAPAKYPPAAATIKTTTNTTPKMTLLTAAFFEDLTFKINQLDLPAHTLVPIDFLVHSLYFGLSNHFQET